MAARATGPAMPPPPTSAMLTHAQIWGAIDALATLAGTSPSGLAADHPLFLHDGAADGREL